MNMLLARSNMMTKSSGAWGCLTFAASLQEFSFFSQRQVQCILIKSDGQLGGMGQCSATGFGRETAYNSHGLCCMHVRLHRKGRSSRQPRAGVLKSAKQSINMVNVLLALCHFYLFCRRHILLLAFKLVKKKSSGENSQGFKAGQSWKGVSFGCAYLLTAVVS
jgi:hypothetical protein